MASDSNDKPPAIVTHPDELGSYHGAGGEPTLVGTATPSPVTSTTKEVTISTTITTTTSSLVTGEEIKIDMREDLVTEHNDNSNPFAFIPSQLEALMDPKNLDLLIKYGGLEGVARGLHAELHTGLSPNAEISNKVTLDSIMNNNDNTNSAATTNKDTSFKTTNNFEQRTHVFGNNVLPQIKGKNIFQLMFLAFRDKTLVTYQITIFYLILFLVLL